MNFRQTIYSSIFFSSLLTIISVDGLCSESEITHEMPPKVGNFILPTTQYIAPLLSFGQTIIDKGQAQLFLSSTATYGFKKHTIDSTPALLYGVTDDFSVLLNFPVALGYKENKAHSSGWEDLYIQFEQAFYSHSTYRYEEQATVVTNMTFPTGSTKKDPVTGVGSPSFFGGLTYERLYADWYGFTSHGIQFTTSHHHTKFGNTFLYQAGLGRNICTLQDKWLFMWLLELNGQYTDKDKVKGTKDRNSGGNIVYLTPSVWVSSEKIIFQFGVGIPILQHLNGNQKRNHYLLATSLGWTF